MEPFSDSTFKKIMAIGIVLVMICVALMINDNSNMKYNSFLLHDYEPAINDELEYLVDIDGEQFNFELKVTEVHPEYLFGAYEKENSQESILDIGSTFLPMTWVTGDLDIIGKDLTQKHSEMVKHTTDFGTLSCREYKYRGTDVTYQDIWPEGLFGYHNTHTGKVSLKVWIYNGHLFDYQLTVVQPDNTTHVLNVSLVNIVEGS